MTMLLVVQEMESVAQCTYCWIGCPWWWDSARWGTVGAAKQGKSYLSNRSALESLSCLASVAPV